MVRSIADNFLSDSLCLAKLCAHPEVGVFSVKALLNILVTDAVLFFEVGKIAGQQQVIKTVELILEDYHHFKPEDFKLCFNRAMKGYYGTIYDRVDGQVILEWLMKYDAERDVEVEAIRTKENKQLKQLSAVLVENRRDADEVFTRNMAKLKETLAANKVARETAEKKPLPVPNEAWVKSQHWMEMFTRLHLHRPYNMGPGSPRFIKRYGSILDVNSFLEHKHWQWFTFKNPIIKCEYRNKFLKK